jgi:peptidoglycan hydrolase-like protein with peptidoglycan-binding domain
MLLINAAYATAQTGTPAQLYPGDAAAAWAQYGGVTPTLLQFTDRAAEGGYQIDMNAYRGTAAALEQLLGSQPTTPVVIPAPAAALPPLVVGTWGPRVTAMQESLAFVNCPCGAADGKFGATTRSGVITFQGRYGLKIDGEYGDKSAGRMHERVTQIQTALKKARFDPGPVDGVPGTNTAAATRRAQAAHHLVQDAVVGPATSHALTIAYP